MICVSNARIIKAFKLLIRIKTSTILNITLKKSTSNNNVKNKATQKIAKLLIAFVFRHIIKSNFDSISTLYITSKQTQVVNSRKLITKVKKKLEKVYVNS